MTNVEAVAGNKSDGHKIFHCGTLTYTKASLAVLFAWLLWGDFCFTLMETVVPSILPLKLKSLGCPNWVMGVMLTTIPGIINVFMCPWVSFKSDRYRSKWGRRIPFIILTIPFLSISVALLGFSDDICVWLQKYVPLLRDFTPTSLTIALIAIFIVMFRLFNVFVNSIFWYLFNDVVPAKFIARFLGMFRIVGTIASATYNYFIFQYAGTHAREIFVGAAILYFIGFGITCLRVKEGEYPPVQGESDKENRGWGAIKTFFKESFCDRIYWLLFISGASQSVTVAIYAFNIFFQQEMGLSLAQIGKIGAVSGIASLAAMYFTAIFIDRWHPLRVTVYLSVFAIIGAAMNWVWIFIDLPAIYFFWLSLGGTLIAIFQTTLADGCRLPLNMRLYPRSRFGQFCSSQAMISWGCIIVAGIASGLFIDIVTWLCHGTNFAYRFIFLWTTAGTMVTATVIVLAYLKWYRLGGDKHFRPPAPWNENGIEEMPIVTTIGPQTKWLNVTFRLFDIIMTVSVIGLIPLMWWLHRQQATAALHWFTILILPLSILAWLFWKWVSGNIRKDMELAENGKAIHNGIPHHGVMMIVAIKFLLLAGLWVVKIILMANLKMETGAIIFGIDNVVTNFMLIGAVWFLARVERGYSMQADIKLVVAEDDKAPVLS